MSTPRFDNTPVIEAVPGAELDPLNLNRMLDKLAQLSELPENWDGYGSPCVQPAVKETAVDLIHLLHKIGMPVPHFAPVSGGGIQLEWHKTDRELELEILPDGDVAFLKVNGSEEMEEGVLPRYFHVSVCELAKWFNA